MEEVRPLFADIDRMVHANLKRVQQAMRRQRIGPHHFAGSTGEEAGGTVGYLLHHPSVRSVLLRWLSCGGSRPLPAGVVWRQRAATACTALPPHLPTAVPPCPPVPATGYGHGDLGRAALDDVVAEVMGAEAAAVRIQYVSGTHAISSALFGCLR